MRSVLVSAGVGGALLLGAGPAQADPAASDAAPVAAQAPAEEGSASLQGTGNPPADRAQETPGAGAPDAGQPAQEDPEGAAPEGPENAAQVPDAANPEAADQEAADQKAVDQEGSVPPEVPNEVSPSLLTGTVELLPVDADTAPGGAGEAPGGQGSPVGNAAPDAGEGTVPDAPAEGESGTPAIEPIRIGDRLFDPEDFNIPAGVASDPALLEEWLLDEANLELLWESEGMLYLTDLMTELLLAGDWEGLEALFLDLLAGDEAAAAELTGWIRGMFELFEEDGGDAGTAPVPTGTGTEAAPAAAVEPAAEKTPARLAVSAAEQAAPLARTAILADTGAGSTAGIAAGGFSLVLAGAALAAWRRRTAQP